MSEGKDRYEERRRLEAENDLLRLRRENTRLKSEAMADEMFRQLHAFFTGHTAITVKGFNETFDVWFCAVPPEPPEPPHGR